VDTADVVVVGAGVIGSAVGYYLSRSGVSVVLVESTTPAGTGSASGACAGGVRCQGRARPELALAVKGLPLWTYLEDELGCEIEYRRCGHVTLVEDEESLEKLAASVKREHDMGLKIEIVGRQELEELVPGIAPGIIGGAYCPTDGQANPILTTYAFAKAAERLGARLLTGTRVTNIHCRSGRVAKVETTSGEIACRWVVNAAGAWAEQINAMVGIDLPIRWGAPQMMVTERMPRILGPVLACASRTISLKQTPHGSFVVGGGWITDWDRDRRKISTRYTSIAGSARCVVSLLPALRDVCIVRTWGGLESYCPDDLPIIGEVPEPAGFVLATGFSGHGFGIAPIVGKTVSEIIAEGHESPLLNGLSWRRFQGGEPA